MAYSATFLKDFWNKYGKCPCSKHNTCIGLFNSNTHFAAAVCALLNYNDTILVVGLGKECGKKHKYYGQYNLCAGSGELYDTNKLGELCFLETAMRELREEFKINAPFAGGVFDSLFKGTNGKIRVMVHNRTPVFIAVLPKGFSRAPIKNKMAVDCKNNPNHSEREMDDFEWFKLSDGTQLEGKPCEISIFAEGVRKRVNVNML
jgi:8-oxo-dGTP pyrophosphatase MutT (NUDIX family)